MAERQSRQCSVFVANAATLLVAALLAAPVLAAPSTETRCDDVADATLEIPTYHLKAEIVSHDSDTGTDDTQDTQSESDILIPAVLLTPQAEATLREAFDDAADSLAEPTPVSDETVSSESTEAGERRLNTRVHGVTDSELARYRRQMYRNDI